MLKKSLLLGKSSGSPQISNGRFLNKPMNMMVTVTLYFQHIASQWCPFKIPFQSRYCNVRNSVFLLGTVLLHYLTVVTPYIKMYWSKCISFLRDVVVCEEHIDLTDTICALPINYKERLAPAFAANCFIKGYAMCYHVYVIVHVKNTLP